MQEDRVHLLNEFQTLEQVKIQFQEVLVLHPGIRHL